MKRYLPIAALVSFFAATAYAGVNVSSPATGQTVTSPVQVVASATMSYPVIAMQVYVDGKLSDSKSANTLNDSVTVATGTHVIVVQSWDDHGNYAKSGSLSITINGTAPPPAPSPTAPTSTISSSFFGMSENGVAAWSPWPTIGFGTLRMWDTGTRWNQIQTSASSFNWSKADQVVNLARNNGKDIIYTFGGTPTWASSVPTQGCGYGNGSCGAPRSMSDLSAFAKAVATRYKGKIAYYEVWNEPNDLNFYTGSLANMVAMAQTIHDAIKSVDPSAVILSPCATWSSAGAPYIWMTNFLKAGGGSYFDIASYHAYPGTSGPEFIISSVQNMRTSLTNAGYGSKQIFITESGWGQNIYFSSEDTRANFVARLLVLAAYKGISKLAWYAYDSNSWGTLYTAGGGLRPAGVAHSQVFKWLTGATLTGCAQDSNATWACTLSRANGYSAQIIWNPNKTIGYNVSTSLVRKWILSGTLSTFSGGNVTVGPKPILIENKAGF